MFSADFHLFAVMNLNHRNELMIMKIRDKTIRRFLLAASLPCLVSCHAGESRQPSQALATVNGIDITVHQVNAELRAAPGSGDPRQLQQRALARVIDRDLLAHRAIQEKIDRDPVVLMAIERSRAQILAQAYLQSRLGTAIKPGPADIATYTQDHPALFVNRKLYSLRTLALPAAALSAEVAGLIDAAGSLDEVAAMLRRRQIAFADDQAYRSSADLPPPLLANLAVVSRRPVFIMRDGEQALVAALTLVRDTPVSGVEAASQAEQLLAASAARQYAQRELGRLRQGATIIYAKGSEPVAPGPLRTPPPAAPAANSDAADPAAKPAVEAGVAGLR
jgi:peptidyl-prolyl cis-trans isomerase C